MTEALSKLIDFFVAWWAALRCWDILPAEEIGFIRRLGKPARDMRAGFNWRWPVIEKAETVNGQEGIYFLDPQSLRTTDGVGLVLRASVTFRVVSARRYHLEAWGATENLRDLVAGELGEVVRESTAADVYEGRATRRALARSRQQARKWGIQIVRIRCADMARSRSIRRWNTNTTAAGET